MYVKLYLNNNRQWYNYDNVNLFDIGSHKFPSGRVCKSLTLCLDSGTTVSFAFSEVGDLIVENYEDEVHPWHDHAKIIFVEDGQTYEKRF